MKWIDFDVTGESGMISAEEIGPPGRLARALEWLSDHRKPIIIAAGFACGALAGWALAVILS